MNGFNPETSEHPAPAKTTWTLKSKFMELYRSEPVRLVRKLVILLVGFTVLLIGIALIVLPGPAFVVIPLGLAILAIEFAWARRWLRKARALVSDRFKK